MPTTPPDAAVDDPFLWLEAVEDPRALAWAREHNAVSESLLPPDPTSPPTRRRLLQVLNSRDRIPYIQRVGAHVYNFWTDEAHPARPVAPHHAGRLPPAAARLGDRARPRRARPQPKARTGSGTARRRCRPAPRPVSTAASSRCRAAAPTRRWCASSTWCSGASSPDGFTLPEAKSQRRLDRSRHALRRHRLRPGRDDRLGLSARASSAGSAARRWRRRDACSRAGPTTCASTHRSNTRPASSARHFVSRAIDFYRDEDFAAGGGRRAGAHRQAAATPTCSVQARPHAAGPAQRLDRRRHDLSRRRAARRQLRSAFLRGERRFDVLFAPTPTRIAGRGGMATTRSHVLLNVLDNVSEPARGTAPRRRRLAARARCPCRRRQPVGRARCTTRRSTTTRWPRPTC